MGESKRRKLLDPNYGKPAFNPESSDWLISDEYDAEDPSSGTLKDCLCRADVESVESFIERYKQATKEGFFFLPDFSEPPNDEEYNRSKKIAMHNGKVCVNERWTIEYSPERAAYWRI